MTNSLCDEGLILHEITKPHWPGAVQRLRIYAAAGARLTKTDEECRDAMQGELRLVTAWFAIMMLTGVTVEIRIFAD